jgi:hypothetical protein
MPTPPGKVGTYVYYTGKGRNANGIHTPSQFANIARKLTGSKSASLKNLMLKLGAYPFKARKTSKGYTYLALKKKR